MVTRTKGFFFQLLGLVLVSIRPQGTLLSRMFPGTLENFPDDRFHHEPESLEALAPVTDSRLDPATLFWDLYSCLHSHRKTITKMERRALQMASHGICHSSTLIPAGKNEATAWSASCPSLPQAVDPVPGGHLGFQPLASHTRLQPAASPREGPQHLFLKGN